METISIRGLGALLGIDDKVLRRAIESGKISRKSYRVNKANGRPELYKVRALKDCRDHGIGMKKGLVIEESFIEEHTKKKEPIVKAPRLETQEYRPAVPEKPKKPSIAESKQDREIIRLQMEKLTLAERQSVLVVRTRVYEELYSFGNEIKTKALSMPDKYLDLMLNASDRGEAYKIFNDAIFEMLETLSSTDQLKI